MSPEKISQQTMRIIDANLDRIGEGLRVLEDLARFMLSDAKLTQQLKNMRHHLLASDWLSQQQLIQTRNSESDVGADMEVPGAQQPRDLPAMVVANARRVQEALRVMEETAKLSETKLDSDKFKRARFKLYELERTLLSRLLRQDKVKRLLGLYIIIDTHVLKGKNLVEAAGQAIRGGATVVQLRDKLLSRKELLPIARQLRELCAENNVLFIVNDYLDLALATDADGLHLGLEDLPIKEARKLLNIDQILGGSTRTVDQATAAESNGADYIAVGSIYPTSTKDTAVVVGLERLRRIRQAVSLPLVAIGGITRDNAAEVIAAGAGSAAVISAVLQADDIAKASREIVHELDAQP